MPLKYTVSYYATVVNGVELVIAKSVCSNVQQCSTSMNTQNPSKIVFKSILGRRDKEMPE
jgi:hypothetical protein